MLFLAVAMYACERSNVSDTASHSTSMYLHVITFAILSCPFEMSDRVRIGFRRFVNDVDAIVRCIDPFHDTALAASQNVETNGHDDLQGKQTHVIQRPVALTDDTSNVTLTTVSIVALPLRSRRIEGICSSEEKRIRSTMSLALE